jgi:hypothetical protein
MEEGGQSFYRGAKGSEEQKGQNTFHQLNVIITASGDGYERSSHDRLQRGRYFWSQVRMQDRNQDVVGSLGAGNQAGFA